MEVFENEKCHVAFLFSVELVLVVNNRMVVDKGVVLVPTADKLMTWSCAASSRGDVFQERTWPRCLVRSTD